MPKKILIVSPSWIGDCVMTQPLLRRLRRFNPDCRIDVFAPKWSMAVYRHMPEAADIIENPFGHGALALKQRWKLGRRLGRRGYGQVIVLPGSLKSAFIAFATGIRRRTGYVGESRYFLLNDIRRLDKAALPLMVDRYTSLAYPKQDDFDGHTEYPSFSIDAAKQGAALEKYGLNTESRIIAFCPGAEYGPAKRWPPRHFAALAKRYAAQNCQIWLFGSHKDRAAAEEINRLAGGLCANLCGHTDLDEAIELLACADTAVCNDSGLMHLAAAVGCKIVAVYGSSSPEHTPPLSHRAKIVSLNLPCSPCFKRECPLGHTDCLNKLLPEQVWLAAEGDMRPMQNGEGEIRFSSGVRL